jgi:opacity protein-like surface antigen
MRRLAIAIVMMASASAAQAADMPDFSDLPILRGGIREGLSTRTVQWGGFYVGGQAAYGVATSNFNGATGDLTAQQLALTTIENEYHISNWPVIGGQVSNHSTAFGGFAGYNSQWDDVVLGIDVSYMRGNFNASASGTMARSFTTSDDFSNNVRVTSAASIHITDVGTVRARAAYVVGNFLPYMFGGVAFGRADISRTNTVNSSGTYVGTNPALIGTTYGPNTSTISDNQNAHMLLGYTAGLGTEMMLFGNVFARGEWEYIRFTGRIDTSINTVRGGLGYKF